MTRSWGPVVAGAATGLVAGLAVGRSLRGPIASSPSASLDSARVTLDGMRETCAQIAGQRCEPGSDDAAAALLMGVAVAIGQEADEALRVGTSDVGASLVFLLSAVLDTMDSIRGVETA